jgi:CheY-like chemotaxis protein
MPPEPRAFFHALIIEDNRDLARLFSDLLGVLGCSCDVAASGQAGVSLALAHVPDLVFCDLRLPGDNDGFAVARMLRADPRTRDTRLIAVTGYDAAWVRTQAQEAGFDDVFGKPVKFAQVQAVIAELARGRHATNPCLLRAPGEHEAVPRWTGES